MEFINNHLKTFNIQLRTERSKSRNNSPTASHLDLTIVQDIAIKYWTFKIGWTLLISETMFTADF